MELDPDDPRPPYQQVAATLRAAILTRKIEPGEQLPSQAQLSERFDVSRMTVQQALRILKDEGLTVSRQGSGVYVRERTSRPAGLRPHIEQAFAADDVTIDFAGFTAETLASALQEPVDHVRSGRYTPESITIRMLTADVAVPVAFPADADGDAQRDADIRARSAAITARSTSAVGDAVTELERLGLVPSVHVEHRTFVTAPTFKCYVINGTDVFFGLYPVQRIPNPVRGTPGEVFDAFGRDAVLFQHTAEADDQAVGSQYVQQFQAWFQSLWDTVAVPQ